MLPREGHNHEAQLPEAPEEEGMTRQNGTVAITTSKDKTKTEDRSVETAWDLN